VDCQSYVVFVIDVLGTLGLSVWPKGREYKPIYFSSANSAGPASIALGRQIDPRIS
jgi:hypothetical protein